jgi:DNA-binding MarR family transcriptional regulator
MTCDTPTSYDPEEDAALSAEIRALMGIDALHNRIMAVFEDMSEGDQLPKAARRLILRLVAPTRLGDLANVLNVLPSTLTGLVNQLEAEGLAERSRDPRDRRAWLLSLTEKGQAERLEMVEKASEVFHGITGFDEEDTIAFVRLTDKARRNLHETLLNRSRT